MGKFEVLVLVSGVITARICNIVDNSDEGALLVVKELLTTAGEIQNQVKASKGVRQDRM